MRPDLKELAIELFHMGAVKFGAFKLKLHEKDPGAPLSPVYLNLRATDHPKNPGPLTPSFYARLAPHLERLVSEHKIVFDAVCGIPDAGSPLEGALAQGMEQVFADFTREHPWTGHRLPKSSRVRPAYLRKETGPDGTRRVVKADGFNGETSKNRVLLLDDVIAMADTKLEAKEAFEIGGWRVAAVIALVDRCQGGSRLLWSLGLPSYTLWTLPGMMDVYVDAGLVPESRRTEVNDYLAANADQPAPIAV
jgi:orotate phosphoribosyltransferase